MENMQVKNSVLDI